MSFSMSYFISRSPNFTEYTPLFLGIYRVYLKCLDTFLEWVPHTKTRKKVYINTCRQKLSLWGTAQQCADLNLLDFYLKGHLKSLAYSAPIKNRETLHQHIYNTCQTIHNCPRTFQNVRQSMTRHVHLCVVSGTGNFDHLMWNVTWSTIRTQRLLKWECEL